MLYCALKHLLRGYISCYVFSPQNKQTRNTKGLKETCGGDGYVCYLDCGGSMSVHVQSHEFVIPL